MRRFLPVFLCLLATMVPAGAAITVVRLLPEYRTADSFVRLSEFFTGKENTGGDVVLRSQPGARAGYYFLLRLDNDGAADPAVRFELDVIRPGQPVPVTYTFDSALPTGREVYHLGLTGTDWPNPEAEPVAWQLRLLSSTGAELLHEQSFLWSLPGTE